VTSIIAFFDFRKVVLFNEGIKKSSNKEGYRCGGRKREFVSIAIHVVGAFDFETSSIVESFVTLLLVAGNTRLGVGVTRDAGRFAVLESTNGKISEGRRARGR